MANLSLTDLVTNCSKCNGTGRLPRDRETAHLPSEPCHHCDGTGKHLTDLGKVLRDFFRLLEKNRGL